MSRQGVKATGKGSTRHSSTLKATRQSNSPPAGDQSEAIVDAAARCFARWGIPRTRVEDVAAEVGMARPHIYRHFASKDAIVYRVILREVRHHNHRMAERFPLRGPTADIIVGSLVSGILEASRDTYTKFLMRSDSARITAQSVRSSPEIVAEVRAHWEPILEYARQRGELKEGIDIKDATRWLTFLEFSYLALPELVPDKKKLVQELRAFVIPALLRDVAPTRRKP